MGVGGFLSKFFTRLWRFFQLCEDLLRGGHLLASSDWVLPHTLPHQFHLERTEAGGWGWSSKERREVDEETFLGIPRTLGEKKTLLTEARILPLRLCVEHRKGRCP